MSSSSLITTRELRNLRSVTSRGFENAAQGLSAMINKEIKVVPSRLRRIRVERVPALVGRPDEVVVALYLKVSGDVKGHIMLILSLDAADELVMMLMGSKREETLTLEEMERSALGEVANITGSFFLNALADATDLLIHPSPPVVIVDMAGAALDVPLSSLALSREDVLVVDTRFNDDERQIKGLLLMLPDIDSLRLIVGRLEPKHA